MILRYLVPAVLFFMLALPSVSLAAPPEQKLTISFDIEAGLLHGSSSIVVPAGIGASLFLHDLRVRSLTIDGVARELGEGEEKIALEAGQGERRIELVYDKVFSVEQGKQSGGMIAAEGIALFGSWHPTLSVDTLFRLEAEIPPGFEAVSEAETITETTTDSGKRVDFSFAHPLAGINFVAGPYIVEEASFGDNQRLYTYFFAEDRELAEHYREKALGYLDRYSNLLGPYPYRRFSIVENRLPTGYAMPTFTLLGQSVVRLPFIVDTSLGHEIVHSWFGNCVRVAADSGNWTEGLVTYLADYAFAVDRGEELSYRKDQLSRYQSYVHSKNGRSVMEFFGADIGNDAAEIQTMRAIGYGKVSMIFHMLYRQLGDKAFYGGLRDFFRTMQEKRAGWDDLQLAFEENANVSLATFFDQWTKRSDVPRLRIKDLSYDFRDGEAELSFTLVQENENPYQLIVPLTLYGKDGPVEKILQTDVREKQVVIPVAQVPYAMSIDPQYNLMRQLEDHEWPPVWSRFEGATRKLVVFDDGKEELFKPFVEQLSAMGCTVKKASEATDDDVAAGAALFLGLDSPLVRSLFAEVKLPADGFTVSVRPHPLAVSQVVVLVSAASAEEVVKASYKVKHYGKYSYLHFVDGRVQEKRQVDSEEGMRYSVDQPPAGIETKSTLFFERVMDELAEKRVVYVGEIHNAYGDHLLQFRIIRDLFERDSRLAIGMEMFSRSAQPALDAFVAGQIDEKTMLQQTNYFKQWGYDYGFYREILQYARRHRIPVIGLNIENEVARKIFREGGVGSLAEDEKVSLPEDRDLDMPGYQERILTTFYMHGSHGTGTREFKDFFQVQAIWDETMAESVAQHLDANPDQKMVVLAGREHVLKDTAIPPRVSRRMAVAQAVVTNRMREDADEPRSDFVFFAPPAQLPPSPVMGVRLMEKEDSVSILDVAENSPAEKAGVKAGDILLALDGQQVASVQDIKIAMIDKQPGESIKVRVQRPGVFFGHREIDIDLVL